MKDDVMKKKYRVKKEKDFQQFFKSGKSFANKNFVLYILEKPEQSHFRLGISVGKKIGNAVKRNAMKRKIRQGIFEIEKELRSDIDFLIIARPGAAKLTMFDVKKNLIHICKLAKICE